MHIFCVLQPDQFILKYTIICSSSIFIPNLHWIHVTALEAEDWSPGLLNSTPRNASRSSSASAWHHEAHYHQNEAHYHQDHQNAWTRGPGGWVKKWPLELLPICEAKNYDKSSRNGRQSFSFHENVNIFTWKREGQLNFKKEFKDGHFPWKRFSKSSATLK